uniref:Uncharacterized protein n=1 Tax=Physcomitrium patens TaxID=3218 RepID=A0A2K1INC0_PHYPA|nr:hypothetical protein PHYPA_027089 [Physcomitrium patens]
MEDVIRHSFRHMHMIINRCASGLPLSTPLRTFSSITKTAINRHDKSQIWQFSCSRNGSDDRYSPLPNVSSVIHHCQYLGGRFENQ